jgi:adenosylmethionine-8-amino-7-oxononanoate aminotransferase
MERGAVGVMIAPPPSRRTDDQITAAVCGTSSRTESSYLLKPNLSTKYPIVDRGEGPYLFDTDGRRYFDGSSGAMTANLGHGLREIAERNAATA